MATVTRIVRKCGDVVWQAKVRCTDPRGKKHSISKVHPTERIAKKWADGEEAAIRSGAKSGAIDRKNRTVAKMLEGWLGDWEREHPQTKPKDLQGMRMIAAWWSTKIGHLAAAELERADVRECVRLLRSGEAQSGGEVSNTTCNRYLAWLSAACSWGVAEGWMASKPTAGCRLKENPARERYLSASGVGGGGGRAGELEALFEAVDIIARDPACEGWRIRLLVHLALATGARKGELMALRWRHVDLLAEQITLQETKNKRPRTVPIASARALKLLRARHAERPRFGRSREDDLVFPGSFPEKQWGAAREISGLKDVHFHDLRHSAATYLTKAGVPEMVISAVLGHSSASMTRRYAHMAPQTIAGAGAQLRSILDAGEGGS